jgi:hypothetical protein
MSRHLRILHLNVGKRKQVQQSLLNDETLKDFDALATVEPYIYRHLHTGKPIVTPHTSWQMFMLKAEDAQTPSDSNLSSAGTETGMHRHSVSPPRPPAGDED